VREVNAFIRVNVVDKVIQALEAGRAARLLRARASMTGDVRGAPEETRSDEP
jgi:hypothetical protein